MQGNFLVDWLGLGLGCTHRLER